MQGYPRLKFVDTNTPREQIGVVHEEIGEWATEVLNYYKYLDNNILADPTEAIREGHDVCQAMVTWLHMMCEQHNINFEATLQECIDKGIKRDGNRSERHNKK